MSTANRYHRQQPNPGTQSIISEQWTRLILAYARHRKLFLLRVEDAETTGSDWEEVLRNERINSAVTFMVWLYSHPERQIVIPRAPAAFTPILVNCGYGGEEFGGL
jgi:hypothetical protein